MRKRLCPFGQNFKLAEALGFKPCTGKVRARQFSAQARNIGSTQHLQAKWCPTCQVVESELVVATKGLRKKKAPEPPPPPVPRGPKAKAQDGAVATKVRPPASESDCCCKTDRTL